MKFGDKLATISKGIYQDFYIDYSFLRDFVKDYNVDFQLFRNAIVTETKKLNAFVCTMQNHPTFTKKELLTYILYNYIGIFKIFKKYDKLRSKNTKKIFFDMISDQGFYRHYINHTRKFGTDIRLVVFGCEGVLIQRQHLFGNLVVKLINRLENIFPDICKHSDVCQSIWKYLGYDECCKRISSSSIIVNGDTDDIRNAICDYIINKRRLVICENENDRRQIINMIRQEWYDIEISKKTIKESGNIRALFEFFKMKGIKIAICTSCERKLIEDVLLHLNLFVKLSVLNKSNVKITQSCKPLHRREPFEIDYLICGNDMIPCNPSPDALLRICNKMKISPNQSMIVGDMPADIHAGINAQFSRTVAIRPGPSSVSNMSDATNVILSIDKLPQLFLMVSEEMI